MSKIRIDFDGVLADYKGEWKGEECLGEPLSGVEKFLKKLLDSKIGFVVFTSRKSIRSVSEWFKKHNLPKPLKVTNIKVPALAYIDDRGVCFDGNFDHLLKSLNKFRVYWSREKPFRNITD